MKREDRAAALFLEGYNCAQSVFGALAPELGLDQSAAMRLASSFGGGVGRLRELCGALSGALMALGLARGYDGPETGEVKAAHYALVRRAAAEFRRENGAVLCRELLGPGAEVGGTPAPRTAEFYASRPCLACIRSAAAIAGRLMDERPETT